MKIVIYFVLFPLFILPTYFLCFFYYNEVQVPVMNYVARDVFPELSLTQYIIPFLLLNVLTGFLYAPFKLLKKSVPNNFLNRDLGIVMKICVSYFLYMYIYLDVFKNKGLQFKEMTLTEWALGYVISCVVAVLIFLAILFTGLFVYKSFKKKLTK